MKFSHENKIEIANRINEIKNIDYLINIKNIISKHNKHIVFNYDDDNEITLQFNKLNSKTYTELTNYLKKLNL